jgi:hypothetical protein
MQDSRDRGKSAMARDEGSHARQLGRLERDRRTGTGTRRTLGALLGRSLLILTLCMAALPAAAAPPTVWTAPSLVRIGPDEAAGTATDIQLYAAKGETESFQILVKAPAGGLTNVNVIAPSLGGPKATLYREYYAYLPRSSADWSGNLNHPLGPGWYPDGLIPFVNPDTGQDLSGTLDAVPFSLAAGKNQPIWVDISVPRTTAAGSYSGTFQVTSAQGTATVTLHLTVWNFALPVQPAMKSLFRYSQSAYSRVSQPARELIRHRLMPQFVPTTEERSLIDNYGLNGTDAPFYSNASLSSGTISPAPSAATFQAEAAKHQSDLPLYCYMADEIGWYTAFYPTIKDWGRNMHTAGIDNLITMMPDPLLYDDGSGTGRSAVDFWVVLPKQYDQVPDRMQYVISKGDEGWSYNCLAQDNYSPKWLLDMAPINYRIQPGFINQSLNLTGLLYWAVDYWGSDPWNNPMPWSPYPAEGLLVYPGANVGLPGQTIGSIRLKWLRDGVDDYDYIQLLKQQGQGAWALSVARTIGPDWRNWSRDPVALEAARRQLGEKLNSLGGGTPTDTVTASASVNPSSVASGGTAYLTGSATDSAGHPIVSWSWSDGGAGGSFSSAAAQSPVYTAPTNTGTTNKTVVLTVTAKCGDATPATGSASATLAVTPATSTHTLTVTASASPATVASAGTATLTATATDSLALPVASWSWSDGGAGGTFSSTTVQNPTYRAPANTGSANQTVTLTVRATSSGTPAVSASASRTLTVTPATTSGHYLTVTATGTPSTVASGGSTALAAAVTDSQPHSGFAYQWSDGGAGGTFSSTTVANPTYRAPANAGTTNRTITLTVDVSCRWYWPWVSVSAATTLTVQPATAPPHTLTVTASATPSTVASAGTASLGATALDSSGHTIVSWSWSDGGAGGRFSSSISQTPTYTAPANTGTTNRTLTLTVTATCSGPTPISSSGSTTLTVQPAPTTAHTLTVAASASPSTVASAGTATLTATAADSQGHPIASWLWSDGGAGGTFSSATAQNPTYQAPANTGSTNRALTLTVRATCGGTSPISNSASTVLTVQPAPTTGHYLTVTATGTPSTMVSGGSTALLATVVDSQPHSGFAYQWSDGGAGGAFSSTTVANPTYQAPANTGTTNRTITLTVDVSCRWYWPWVSASASTMLTVQPATAPPHTLTVTASAAPTTVASAGTASLGATALDSSGHTVASWSWSDGGAGGRFSSSVSQSPTYTAPVNAGTTNRTVTLTVTATCSGATPISSSASTTLTVQPAPTALHTLTVTTSASPNMVASAGTTALSASAVDSQGHPIASWAWSDGGAGGTFSSTTAQNPTYRAPANTGTTIRTITLTVRATCSGTSPMSASASTVLTVQPATTSGHYLTVTATASPSTVASGGSTALAATVADSQPHSGFAYQWSDGGAGGTFSSTTTASPTYRAPVNTSGASRTVTLTLTVTCKWYWPWVSASTSVPLIVQSQ